MKRHQLYASFFLLLFGIFISFAAQGLKVGWITRPGPGFFPFWLGVALIIVALSLVAKSILKKGDESVSSKSLWKGLNYKKAVFSLVALLSYAFLLEPLGYCIATSFLMFFLFWVIGGYRLLVGIGSSIVVSLFSYILFKLFLQVQLPKGLWGI